MKFYAAGNPFEPEVFAGHHNTADPRLTSRVWNSRVAAGWLR
jgi:hypothetical protein